MITEIHIVYAILFVGMIHSYNKTNENEVPLERNACEWHQVIRSSLTRERERSKVIKDGNEVTHYLGWFV
jgi:hypothetical protein